MKRFLTRFCLALLAISQGWAGILTGPATNPVNGHRYYLLTPQNWESAEEEAKTLGGHLATVNDEAEDQWIFRTFSTFGGVNRTLMIGLNDARLKEPSFGPAARLRPIETGTSASQTTMRRH